MKYMNEHMFTRGGFLSVLVTLLTVGTLMLCVPASASHLEPIINIRWTTIANKSAHYEYQIARKDLYDSLANRTTVPWPEASVPHITIPDSAGGGANHGTYTIARYQGNRLDREVYYYITLRARLGSNVSASIGPAQVRTTPEPPHPPPPLEKACTIQENGLSYALPSGFHFIAVPFQTDMKASDLIELTGFAWIRRYKPGGDWVQYPDEDIDFPIEPGVGYEIFAAVDIEFTIDGEWPTEFELTIPWGMSLIGVPVRLNDPRNTAKPKTVGHLFGDGVHMIWDKDIDGTWSFDWEIPNAVYERVITPCDSYFVHTTGKVVRRFEGGWYLGSVPAAPGVSVTLKVMTMWGAVKNRGK